jgi:phenylacetate-CoA ligase
MHPSLSSFLSARLLDRRGGHRRRLLAAFREKAEHDFLPRADLDRIRNEQLARLLEHARGKVPRYRKALGAGDPITADRALAILKHMPVLARRDVQTDPGSLTASDAGPMAEDATGGSSGTPMVFRVDGSAQLAREASLMWADSLCGWRYGERIAMLWGSDRDVTSATGRLKTWARWQIENRRWYNAFDMGEADMARFHREMARFRPHILVAYAGSAFAFARFLEARGRPPGYPLRGIVSSAEMLTPPMREAIERVFGKPVFDRYGNREAGALAAECVEHTGLHVNESDVIVEVDSRDPCREPGPLLITYLRNFGMPLIRYDTGDLATLADGPPCPCGRRTLRLARVEGRASDTLRTASGRLIHGEFFTHVLYGNRAVRAFQFVQEDAGTYELILECREEDVRGELARWRKEILDAVGMDSRLAFRFMEKIPPLPSGKRKFTVSKIPARAQE